MKVLDVMGTGESASLSPQFTSIGRNTDQMADENRSRRPPIHTAVKENS
ncbi:MAG TPA: hypothetical protein VEY51_09485 [Chondromyces sp.]|nr:hypothetical protein [Chondromyces sp.]